MWVLLIVFHNLSSLPLCLQLLFNSHCKCTTELKISYVSVPIQHLPNQFNIPISFHSVSCQMTSFQTFIIITVCAATCLYLTRPKGFNNNSSMTSYFQPSSLAPSLLFLKHFTNTSPSKSKAWRCIQELHHEKNKQIPYENHVVLKCIFHST